MDWGTAATFLGFALMLAGGLRIGYDCVKIPPISPRPIGITLVLLGVGLVWSSIGLF